MPSKLQDLLGIYMESYPSWLWEVEALNVREASFSDQTVSDEDCLHSSVDSRFICQPPHGVATQATAHVLAV